MVGRGARVVVVLCSGFALFDSHVRPALCGDDVGARGVRRAAEGGRTPPCSYGSGLLRSGTEVKGRWRRAPVKRMEDAARDRTGGG